MLISKQWLSEFVGLPKNVSNAELGKRITLSTVEVEKVIDQADALNGVVVGRVVSCAQHPNADRLKVCQVDVGSQQVQIVCGGTNVAEGMMVAVALPGAWVRWHGEGEPIELKETKIRGEASFGMICASVELGLDAANEGEHEIRNLGAIKEKPGTPLARVLGRDDVLFDIEHKSLTNRPDLMGHYGMAREVSALYGTKLNAFKPHAIKAGKTAKLSVSVESPALCPRYVAVALDGVVVGPSPAWMRDRLTACGIRSINNVVDVTNYVMLELGQPMHAFDASQIPNGQIVVRPAKKGETLKALDGEAYALDADMLVIANAKEPIAIAGVMGGEQSGVSAATTSIIFESANFAPASVRKTSTRLGLRSESSARFEKSLDATQCDAALARAVELLLELCPSATVASAVVDKHARAAKPLSLTLPMDAPERLLGVKIPAKEVKDILTRLGFTVTTPKSSTAVAVTVPTWRATKDISIAEDVIEEIARIYGYDRIPSALPHASIAPPPMDPVRAFARRARRTLALGLGATEAYQYAFVRPETLATLGFKADEYLKLANPLSSERPYLVQSLLPNLFEAVALNQHAFPVVSLFEMDRVFFGTEERDQPHHLAIAYSALGDEAPFSHVRQMVVTLLSDAGLTVSFGPISNPAPWMHAGRSADILVDGKKKGIIAEALPDTASALGIDRRVAVAEMNATMIAAHPRRLAAFEPIPVYPDVKRDLAFLVDERAAYEAIEQACRRASNLVTRIELFDVYRGKGIPDGQKSLAIHVDLRAPDRTLASEEADAAMKALAGVIEKQFGGTIRM